MVQRHHRGSRSVAIRPRAGLDTSPPSRLVGLGAVAVIGIIGLIWITSKGISLNDPNIGPVIAIIFAAVGAMVGASTGKVLRVVTRKVLTSTTTKTTSFPEVVIYVAVFVLGFVAVGGTSLLIFGNPFNIDYQMHNLAVVFISAAVGVFGGVLTPLSKNL